jgi:hypothetical protein
LSVDSEEKKATPKNWVFEVYGRSNVDFVKDLAEELFSVYQVKIHIRLESENPQFEFLGTRNSHCSG